ncbi:MAG: fasciclin domain-containing protein [Bacteroidaceae bacterium]|nr:fasciclin domain-containing protein [Bacteroidaceae bacterium]
MKHTKILALATLLIGMVAEGQAQVFQIIQKDGRAPKFQAAAVDSLSHNNAEGLTTIHLKDGKKETFQKAATDSIVWYDPTNSILGTLRQNAGYTLFLRLVQESEWWTDMLNGATDLTVFAADDNAWQRFFAENAKLPSPNPWRTATSYEALTADQKRALLYTAITAGSINRADLIRTKSLAAGLEALEHLSGSEVPMHYNPAEKWYWERFHEANGGKGIWLASDSSFRYTSFFTPEKLKTFNVTETDLSIIFPAKAPQMANGVDILQQDIPATNGTIQDVASPLVPLQSMADVIRTNGKTNIFSHILDRFSAPFYSPVLTESYKKIHPEFTDSIFTKRYFSYNNYSLKGGYLGGNSWNVPLFEPGPWGTYQSYNPYKDNSDYARGLRFDPGWAGYYYEVAPEKDMAAMFVPSDEALWHYFTKGAGQALILTYYANIGTADEIPYTAPTNYDELYRQIDCIPVSTMASILVNNNMMRSFTGSVPSKWGKLFDDAMEPLFDDADEALGQLDTCLLANNGMVYVMNHINMPADFRSVTAPAFASKTNLIMKSAIYDDYMGLNYYTYLKAPQQDITFFLPSDSALFYYYDPISMKSRTPRAIEFYFAGGSFPVKLRFRNYYCPYNTSGPDDPDLGTIGNVVPGANVYTNDEVTDRLKDILYNHTIVNDGTQDIHSRNEYFRTFGGDVVKVVRDASGRIIGAKGGFQMENERLGIANDTPGVTECKVIRSYESLSNGQTYALAAPLVPTWRSLYSLMTNDQDQAWYGKEGYGGETPYSEFYKLCTADEYETEIIGCGLVDGSLPRTQRESALKKYKIFTSDKGLDYNFSLLSGNTPYTAFIPTNEAVRKATSQGLPTWDDIYKDYHSHASGDQLNSYEDSIRIAEKIMMLTNFVKAHFCFGMAIADQEPFRREYTSLAYDRNYELFPKLIVDSKGGQEMTVTDWNGNTVNVTASKNVFVRDYTCNSSPISVAMKGIQMNAHRSGVVHLIDGVLGFTGN